MKREYDLLKVYNLLYIMSASIVFIIDVVTCKFNASVPSELIQTDRSTLVFAFVLHILPLLLVFPFFKHTKDIRIRVAQSSNCYWTFDEKKIHCLVSIIMVVNFVFVLRTGIGKADSSDRNELSFLLRIIPPEPLMLLYFVFCHKTKKKMRFWMNFLIFAAYEIATGWTGFILQYGIIELYFFVKYSKKLRKTFSLLKLGVMCNTVIILAGGALYRFLQPLKFAIRYGYGYTGHNTLWNGISELVSRLTDFEATVVSILNHAKIANLYNIQGVWNWEAVSVFRNVLPRFIMPGKDYRILGNLVMNSIYPKVASTTSTGYGLIMYSSNLAEATVPGSLLWAAFYLIFFIVCKKIIQKFETGNGDSEVLYFFLVMTVLQGTPISVSLGGTYLELIYAIFLFPLLGIIKKRPREYRILRAAVN